MNLSHITPELLTLRAAQRERRDLRRRIIPILAGEGQHTAARTARRRVRELTTTIEALQLHLAIRHVRQEAPPK